VFSIIDPVGHVPCANIVAHVVNGFPMTLLDGLAGSLHSYSNKMEVL